MIDQLNTALRKCIDFERLYLHNPEMFHRSVRDASFDRKYLPQNTGALKLDCYWVPRRNLYIYGRQSIEAKELGEIELFEGSGNEQRVLFPIHPTALENHRGFLDGVGAERAAKNDEPIWAVPTSSTRTFLAWPDAQPMKAVFMKTTLHSPILGDRRLYRRKVAASVGMSMLVQSSLSQLPSALTYLMESVGYIPRCMPDSGVIIRSLPTALRRGEVVLAPLFSLFGGAKDREPLLCAIACENGLSPKEFVEQFLCAKFAKLWLESVVSFGVVIEAHGQNLMLCLSPDLILKGGFAYRDFEGLQIDWELRESLGLSSPQKLPHSWSWRETYATWGYRYGDFIWEKCRVSLFDYLHLVLHQAECRLIEWQCGGRLKGDRFCAGEITTKFSSCLLHAIAERFGIKGARAFDIHRDLHRFLVFFMKVRRNYIDAHCGSSRDVVR